MRALYIYVKFVIHRIHMNYRTPIRHIVRYWLAIAVVIIIWLALCVKEWNHHRYVEEHPEEKARLQRNAENV